MQSPSPSHTIWKFPLALDDRQKVIMPEGARILSAQVQDGQLCLWALVDPAAVSKDRTIHIIGAGHPLYRSDSLRYISTVQTFNGVLVWHIFEELTS
jgi:hypothetical protein